MFRHLFRYEHRSEPLLPWHDFLLKRVSRTLLASVLVIVVSLAIGLLGYRLTEGMGWLEAFLNSAMLLGGMGPVDAMHTTAGKLFAGVYALYSGLVLVGVAGLLLTPFLHRLLHRFHLEGASRHKD